MVPDTITHGMMCFTEHYEIYKALEQGNPKLAEKAMLDHLNSVYYTTISAMRN